MLGIKQRCWELSPVMHAFLNYGSFSTILIDTSWPKKKKKVKEIVCK